MIAFDELGYTEAVRAWAQELEPGLEPGRVTSLDRGYPLVNTASEELRAELATEIKKSEDSIVAVGDWVALRIPEGHEKAIIAKIMPRHVEIARIKRVGREKQIRRQVLAANADLVFLCQSLTGEGLDIRLAARQMTAACGCGATPVFVLTKADCVEPQQVEQARELLAQLAPDLRCLAIASKLDQGVEEIRSLIAPGMTALLLGESGVGKSTLVNALLGAEYMATSAVRESDDRGRHTTVARRIWKVPGGGLIIDAPGLRTLQIMDLEQALETAFPDITELSAGCRFSDCSHTHEPGCNVAGRVSQLRLDAYLALGEFKDQKRY
ncbi:MAG: ribosome small subunit-dependent GTPase A [Coriobacteriales bacterium]